VLPESFEKEVHACIEIQIHRNSKKSVARHPLTFKTSMYTFLNFEAAALQCRNLKKGKYKS
jgi:hypothetical protein